MRNTWKKALALCLGVCLGASALAGCGKKANAAPIVTFEGEKIDNDLFTFMFRYEEGQFDEIYGAILSSYYGANSAWNLDLMGTGSNYGESFKLEFQDKFENFLLAEKHAVDYDLALSDEEKKKIGEVADDFLAKNDKDTLKSMCAERDVVVRALELYTIQKKVENAVSAEVDTEVSDDEAAQKKISYICFTPMTGDDAEEETEALTESDLENMTEAEITPLADEPETAAIEAESESKTEAKDKKEKKESKKETEEESKKETKEDSKKETKKDTKKDSKKDSKKESKAKETELLTEARAVETELVTEAKAVETEAVTEAETEPEQIETESEDPELVKAKEKARVAAQEMLDYLLDSDEDFSEFMDSAEDIDAGITTATLSFGEGDSYPDSEIIKAVKDVEDNTLIDHLVEGSNGYYYLVYVNQKFDKEATEQKKKDIIEDRKDEAVQQKYTDWKEGVDFVVDDEAYASILFDRLYTAPERAEENSTEAETELESSLIQTEAETEAE